jgi:hypothetical protein
MRMMTLRRMMSQCVVPLAVDVAGVVLVFLILVVLGAFLFEVEEIMMVMLICCPIWMITGMVAIVVIVTAIVAMMMMG